jgi:hypothetical protein
MTAEENNGVSGNFTNIPLGSYDRQTITEFEVKCDDWIRNLYDGQMPFFQKYAENMNLTVPKRFIKLYNEKEETLRTSFFGLGATKSYITFKPTVYLQFEAKLTEEEIKAWYAILDFARGYGTYYKKFFRR